MLCLQTADVFVTSWGELYENFRAKDVVLATQWHVNASSPVDEIP